MPKPTYNEIVTSLEKAQQIAESRAEKDVHYSYYYLNTVIKRILRGVRSANAPIRNWKDGHYEEKAEEGTGTTESLGTAD